MDAVSCLVENTSSILPGLVTVGFLVQCVFRCWALTLENGDGLEAGRC